VILSLLLALVASQGPKLTSETAGEITRTVVDHLVPTNQIIDGDLVVNRGVIFDRAQAIDAFRKLIPNVDPRDITTTLPSLIKTRRQAITCDQAHHNCIVYQNKVFFAIDAVSATSGGQYRVRASVRWQHALTGGRTEVQGKDYDLLVGLVGSKWKHWEVIRTSSTPAADPTAG